MANERTFLAWIRTALGLLAGAVVIHQLAPPLGIAGTHTVLAVGCVSLAVVLAGGAYWRWRSVQRAMRRDEPLPASALVPVLAVGAVVVAVIAGGVVLLS
ncbi:YidH family protein [Prescottella sp. R16]|uniref:YidH family protein n=1 Tax=Prescottella TaxID=2979332 RepID=UPI00272E2D3F|nr:DUF202 domain-containing protein [Prescottella sp. R16]